MKFAIRTAFIVAVATLSGCASTEIVSSIPTPKSSAVGHITVCRKRIFYGDGAATIIYIDGEATLRSGPGVCFAAFLKTGTHSISVLEDSWLGPNMGKKPFELDPGKKLYFIIENEDIKEVKAQYIDNLLKSNYKMIPVQKNP